MQITGNYHAIQQFYSDERVWVNLDAWHSRTTKVVASELAQINGAVGGEPGVVANIGSGGNDYRIRGRLHVHVDLVTGRLRGRTGVIGNAENLPLKTTCADVVICVGSVINHGNAVQMIGEIARVLRPEGIAVIEFDCSDGLHQVNGARGADCVETTTFFNRHMLTLQEFSRSYIESALEDNGLFVERRHSFHIMSAFLLGLGFSPGIATQFIRFDGVARLIRSIRYRGSNMLLVARRR